MLLSILTPSIPRRLNQLETLLELVDMQIRDAAAEGLVEHLALVDNLQRSVGLKRQALVDAARGQYVAFVDDDDWIEPGYVAHILQACQRGQDVITFEQRAIVNGKVGYVDFRATATDDPLWAEAQTIIRPPWHVCAWRRDRVKDCLFPDINDGEDRIWAMQARARIRTETHIAKVLHVYRFDSKLTAATGR